MSCSPGGSPHRLLLPRLLQVRALFCSAEQVHAHAGLVELTGSSACWQLYLGAAYGRELTIAVAAHPAALICIYSSLFLLLPS
jgi:hypothetical protein